MEETALGALKHQWILMPKKRRDQDETAYVRSCKQMWKKGGRDVRLSGSAMASSDACELYLSPNHLKMTKAERDTVRKAWCLYMRLAEGDVPCDGSLREAMGYGTEEEWQRALSRLKDDHMAQKRDGRYRMDLMMGEDRWRWED